jgi:hypothetical protein
MEMGEVAADDCLNKAKHGCLCEFSGAVGSFDVLIDPVARARR